MHSNYFKTCPIAKLFVVDIVDIRLGYVKE
jgi:hypothetical protein